MPETLTHAELKSKQCNIRGDFPETMSLRVHRAISWIGRSETADEDHDARFVFLWIAFNAAYAGESEFRGIVPGERATFADFFSKILALDGEPRIFKSIWQSFSGPIRMLMQNRYVFNLFWQHHNGMDGYDDWQEKFRTSAHSFAQALLSQDAARTLSLSLTGFMCCATSWHMAGPPGTALLTAIRSATARRSSGF